MPTHHQASAATNLTLIIAGNNRDDGVTKLLIRMMSVSTIKLPAKEIKRYQTFLVIDIEGEQDALRSWRAAKLGIGGSTLDCRVVELLPSTAVAFTTDVILDSKRMLDWEGMQQPMVGP